MAEATAHHAESPIPYMVHPHPVTGIPNGKFGIWLFLASEVMLFGALFSSYVLISWSAWGLAIAQLPFIWNFFASLRHPKAVENPWQATTLEWAAPSPPPHGNFVTPPVVYRDPYEYSEPGRSSDFHPQFAREA